LCYTDVLKEKQQFYKRILIVEDEADVTITFKAWLEDSNGYYDCAVSFPSSSQPWHLGLLAYGKY